MFGRDPTSRRGRALLYLQLAQSLDAGIAVPQALRMTEDGSGKTRGAVAAAVVERGGTIVQAIDAAWGLSPHHRLALASAERAGRLPPCFESLAADLDAEVRARRRLWLRSAYPLLLLHAIAPATSAQFLLAKPAVFMRRVLVATATIWLVGVGALLLHRKWMKSKGYVRALASLPLVGSILRCGAFVRFFRALADLYASGVNIQEALDSARDAAGPAPPVDDFARAAAAARGGASMAAAFESMTSLDPPLRALLATAAQTGDLDDALRRAIGDLEERWRTQTDRLVVVSTSALYAGVVVAVGWTIVSFYADLYSGLSNPH
jgi:type II secretory pathway component PulF